MPASETRARVSPAARRSRTSGIRRNSLCSWQETRGRRDAVAREEVPRPAGVLAEDEAGLVQGREGARGEVLEVADRGGDDEEPSCRAAGRGHAAMLPAGLLARRTIAPMTPLALSLLLALAAWRGGGAGDAPGDDGSRGDARPDRGGRRGRGRPRGRDLAPRGDRLPSPHARARPSWPTVTASSTSGRRASPREGAAPPVGAGARPGRGERESSTRWPHATRRGPASRSTALSSGPGRRGAS